MSPNVAKTTTKCKHILELTAEEKQKFLDSFDIALSDCDGVVWMITGAIPNVAAGINLLKDAGKQYKFISNNGMRTDEDYLNKLEKIGVQNIDKDDNITPVKVIANYVKTYYPGETCYCLASETFCKTLAEAGISVKDVTPRGIVEVEELHKIVTPDEAAKLVIVDIHFNMNYAEFCLMYQYLLKDDCLVFMNCTDTRVPLTADLTILGPGVLLNAVAAECVDKSPIIFGKPSALMAEFFVEEFKITDRKRCIFVGDNLIVDIQFGAGLGMQTLFVLTGGHTKEEMFQQPLDDQPDYYADSMADFVEFFNDLK